MLVLVATKETQIDGVGGSTPADSDPDHRSAVDGELVTPVVARCRSAERCRCGRGFPGFASGRFALAAQVVDHPHISERDLRDAIDSVLDRDGWFDLVDDDERCDLVDEHLECIAAVCAAFPVGTVVERHGDIVTARSIAQAA